MTNSAIMPGDVTATMVNIPASCRNIFQGLIQNQITITYPHKNGIPSEPDSQQPGFVARAGVCSDKLHYKKCNGPYIWENGVMNILCLPLRVKQTRLTSIAVNGARSVIQTGYTIRLC